MIDEATRATIVDGTGLSVSLYGRALDPRAYLLGFYPDAPLPPLDAVAETVTPLRASVNRGIWIAPCDCAAVGIPTPGGVVFFDRPVLWCVRCENAAASGLWRPVVVPAPDERRMIEFLLLCRAGAQHRNWEPGESIDDLIAENVRHGDPIPGFA